MKKFRWNSKYLAAGLTAFLVIVCSLLFYLLIARWPAVKTSIGWIIHVLSPILWGLAIAYLLTPVVKFFQRLLFEPLGRLLFKKRRDRIPSFGRAIAVLLTMILFLALIVALFWLILPQIYQSVVKIISVLPGYVNTATDWVSEILARFPKTDSFVGQVISGAGTSVKDWANNTLLPSVGGVVSNITTGVWNTLMGIVDVLIGVIVSVYLLYSRESFTARVKKFLYSVLPVKRMNQVLRVLRFTNRAFMGFIGGKLLNSLIIGILCYIFCAIARMPYPLLLAVIMGVTDIIPFFGPIIGAVPSALIVLMDSPIKCLIFVIFIIVLQQLDGNVLGPKILGSSTGLSGFWVIFAIVLGGGLFGFLGVLLGVPVFAVIYACVRHLVNRRLGKRGLPEATANYMGREESPVQIAPAKAAETRTGSENWRQTRRRQLRRRWLSRGQQVRDREPHGQEGRKQGEKHRPGTLPPRRK